MSLDRDLVDKIKRTFQDYASQILREIVQNPQDARWSAEARAAAEEVLRDRQLGRAAEPAVPKEPERVPPRSWDLESLAFLTAMTVSFGLVGAMAYLSYRRSDSVPEDDPVAFGSKIAWLALDTRDTAAVAKSLYLEQARQATWAEGVDTAYRGAVFVTPPVADWTLAAGTALFPPDRAQPFVKPLLERLSLEFGDAQYFCTHCDVELHLWARAIRGELVRGYGWLGQRGCTLWDEGLPTREERDLGFRFPEGQATTAIQAAPSQRNELDLSLELDDRKSTAIQTEPKTKRTHVDENGVMQLACLWSIDPTSLDDSIKEPVLGMLGEVAGWKNSGSDERIQGMDRRR